MKNFASLIIIIFFSIPAWAQSADGYELVWQDEFNKDGKPDTANWNYETGFKRNNESQWYQEDNAYCAGGLLIIEARKERKPNPWYKKDAKDYRQSRPFIEYTSACLITQGKHEWQYGRFEMKARIDISTGIWPAWWTLGTRQTWPANGEIDIMEYYRGMLLANTAWQAGKWKAKWNEQKFSIDSLGGRDWADQFHIWRMDWTADKIELFCDDVLLNTTMLSGTINTIDTTYHPFRQPHYMLLNMAVGGDNGGDPSTTNFPRRYEIDYVRVYQKKN